MNDAADVGSPPALSELADEYQLLGELGRGGSAVVYRALDRALGREVAIKVVYPRGAAVDDEAVTRLSREARTVAQLQHPNIVTVFSVRRLHAGGLALVMPLVPGRTLKQVVQREGPLPPERCERVLRDVAEALAYAHARGVVHRDVKPENIFLDEDTGRACLADFGIALSEEHDSMTRTGTAIGTPFYMSPEQIDNGALDGRSDLYSLGLVAWEMLTGRRPWDGESLYNVIYKQKHEELPPIEALRPGVPPRLQYIVERMLQKQPGARWAGADGLLAQLSHTVLPRDYSRWQAAHKKRVERYRAEARAEARARASGRAPAAGQPGAADGGGLASATMRLFRGAGRGALDAAAGGLANTVAVDVPAELRRVGPGTPAGSTAGEATAAPVVSPSVVPGEVEPSWVPAPSPRRRLAILGLASVAVVVAAAAVYLGRDRNAGRLVASSPPGDSAVGGPAVPGGRGPATDTASPLAGVGASAPTSPGGALVPVGRTLGTLAAGGRHSCIVALGASVHCWGANERGQLGNASFVRRATPVRVSGDLAFTQVAAGASHSCAVTRLGDLYCWGNNARGQLGDATTVRRDAPVRIAGPGVYRAVRAGAAHTCALTLDGSVACWGANDRGQLGNGERTGRTRPTPVRAARDLGFAAVSAGGSHTCAITGAGAAFCWGANESGQLGDGGREDRFTPTPVGGGLRFAAIAAGPSHTCAVTPEGEAYCWGRNAFGQVGTRAPGAVPQPSRVRTPSAVSQVVTGSVHSCALSSAGEVYCWGRNSYGQVGDGTTGDRPTPTRAALPEPAVEVDATATHTCAVTLAGRAYCWGYNGEGQLGDSTRVNRATPAVVRLGKVSPAAANAPARAVAPR